MATINEVISHIKSNYSTEDLGNGGLKMEFNIDSNRTQLIFVHSTELMLLVASPFAQNISSDLAFQAAETSIFGVKKLNDLYVLHHVIPVGDIDASEIEFGLKVLALQADELDSKFGRDQF
jgi:hypothetical protein